MANVQYYDVILNPVITEKSMAAMAEKKYTFLVHPEANKTMIKEAVEKMFEGTKVASVNTMNMDGKNKRRGMVYGKTAKTKKAIVQLTEDASKGYVVISPRISSVGTSLLKLKTKSLALEIMALELSMPTILLFCGALRLISVVQAPRLHPKSYNTVLG